MKLHLTYIVMAFYHILSRTASPYAVVQKQEPLRGILGGGASPTPSCIR